MTEIELPDPDCDESEAQRRIHAQVDEIVPDTDGFDAAARSVLRSLLMVEWDTDREIVTHELSAHEARQTLLRYDHDRAAEILDGDTGSHVWAIVNRTNINQNQTSEQ
jgi:hypothetical protein